jgi:hypothetical protein
VQRVVPERVDQRALGPLTGVVYTDGFTLDDNDVALGYLLKRPVEAVLTLSEERELRVQELPAAPIMATAVQVGGPDMVFLALGQIGRWIEDNGYRIASGPADLGYCCSKGQYERAVLVGHAAPRGASLSVDNEQAPAWLEHAGDLHFAHVSALRCSPLRTVTAQELVGRALRLSGARAEPEAQV